MLQLEEAVSRILAVVPPPTGELVALGQASGRILHETVHSPLDLPPFNNSAMDGFAVRSGDVSCARVDAPTRLRVIGRVVAGGHFPVEVSSGTCVRLFTGSALPPGADAVVMQEDTRLDPAAPSDILILEPAQTGENVRSRGEDMVRGGVIATAGEKLNFAHLAALAAAGVRQTSVGRQPRVAILATGSELVEPGKPLQPGQIYESNRVALETLVRGAGGIPISFPVITDVLDSTSTALMEAFNGSDLVVTSGGASVGELDFVKPAFEKSGGLLEFWKVAIKPGRPFVFGRRQGSLLFGLPGNPVSALVTFLLLVRPALLRWQGAATTSLTALPGILEETLANPGNRRHFCRVRIDGAGKVRSAGVQASHMLSSLSAANGLVDLPPDAHLPAGALVPVIRWD